MKGVPWNWLPMCEVLIRTGSKYLIVTNGWVGSENLCKDFATCNRNNKREQILIMFDKNMLLGMYSKSCLWHNLTKGSLSDILARDSLLAQKGLAASNEFWKGWQNTFYCILYLWKRNWIGWLNITFIMLEFHISGMKKAAINMIYVQPPQKNTIIWDPTSPLDELKCFAMLRFEYFLFEPFLSNQVYCHQAKPWSIDHQAFFDLWLVKWSLLQILGLGFARG